MTVVRKSRPKKALTFSMKSCIIMMVWTL